MVPETLKQYNENEIDNFINENVGFFQLELSRISNLLKRQLYHAYLNRLFSIYGVLDEIRFLEGLNRKTMTKEASQFRCPPLNRFWHKHFFDARFVSKNLINYLKSNTGKTKIEDLFRRFKEEGSEYLEEREIGILAHELRFIAFQERTNKNASTGEWLIFSKHEGSNYYLCIAAHTNTSEGDRQLYQFLKMSCREEFPFLFDFAT
jgi:hypothetical protein